MKVDFVPLLKTTDDQRSAHWIQSNLSPPPDSWLVTAATPPHFRSDWIKEQDKTWLDFWINIDLRLQTNRNIYIYLIQTKTVPCLNMSSDWSYFFIARDFLPVYSLSDWSFRCVRSLPTEGGHSFYSVTSTGVSTLHLSSCSAAASSPLTLGQFIERRDPPLLRSHIGPIQTWFKHFLRSTCQHI